MRNYYLNRGTASVYTEDEMHRSRFSREKFELIGQARNRAEAEKLYYEKTGIYPAYLNRRY